MESNEKFFPVGIRDITPHLIHHSQGLTVPIYVVFHEESRGYDPGSISQSYELSKLGGGGPGGRQGRTRRSKTEISKVWPHRYLVFSANSMVTTPEPQLKANDRL